MQECLPFCRYFDKREASLAIERKPCCPIRTELLHSATACRNAHKKGVPIRIEVKKKVPKHPVPTLQALLSLRHQKKPWKLQHSQCPCDAYDPKVTIRFPAFAEAKIRISFDTIDIDTREIVVFLRKFLTTDVERIKSIGSIGAVFE